MRIVRLAYDPLADVVALQDPAAQAVVRDVVLEAEGLVLGFDAQGGLVLLEVMQAQSKAPWLVKAATDVASLEASWMGLVAASRQSGVPEPTLRSACQSGALVAKKVAGHWLVQGAAVAHWLAHRPKRGRPPRPVGGRAS